MRLSVRERPRGQALAESALLFPLFVLVLFAMIWGIRAAVLHERMQSDVRYAGIVLAVNDPYRSFSLYSIYAAANNGAGAPGPSPCVAPGTDQVNAYSQSQHRSGTAFFLPKNGTYSSQCDRSGTGSAANIESGVVGYGGPAFQTGSLLLIHQQVSAHAGVDVPALLHDVLSPTTMSNATANFFRPPSVQTDVQCLPGYDVLLTSTVDPMNDHSSSTGFPGPLPDPVPVTAGGIQTSSACAQLTIGVTAPPPIVNPTPVPTPPPTPTFPPSVSSSPSPAPQSSAPPTGATPSGGSSGDHGGNGGDGHGGGASTD